MDERKLDIEQMKNNVETMVGVLKIKIRRGEVRDQSAHELIEIFEEFERDGTTVEELKLLHGDLVMALE